MNHTADHIRGLIAAELVDYDPDGAAARHVGQVSPMSPDWHRQTLAEFRAALIGPAPTDVLFSGGFVQECWAVTRSNGAYRVIYIPSAELFSLAVESQYGPVDIGVHGDALVCFGSV